MDGFGAVHFEHELLDLCIYTEILHVSVGDSCPLSIIYVSPVQVPVLRPMDLMVEASPRRVFANAHTYHVNSISVNSDGETYLSADDLRVNLWNLEITDCSFSILSALRVCFSGLPQIFQLSHTLI